MLFHICRNLVFEAELGFKLGFLIRNIVNVNVAYAHHKLLHVHLMQRRGSGSSVHNCGFVSEVEGFRSLVLHSIPILKAYVMNSWSQASEVRNGGVS
jgi:hypothetical protein